MRIVNNTKLYTEEELSRLFDLSRPTLAKYRREGRIKATKLGRSYYYAEESVNEYLRGEKLFLSGNR